ncbi:SatD family protein [Halobaculum sp. MBLA0143]|uniref:SatD family protein n=1 Tax=Halobaculum sp. MBLA0143 TaxID=3079933 RepID=UPI00352487D4
MTEPDRAWIVLGDVVDSREIEERDRFELALDALLRHISEEYERDVIADFDRLKGIDEIGAVLGSVRSLVDVRRTLTLGLHPERVRLVAYRGEVNDLSAETVGKMDGAGFAGAADELGRIEEQGLTFVISGLPMEEEYVSTVFNLTDHVRSRWTANRVRAIRAYDRLGSQVEAANLLDVSRQAINQHLTSDSVKLVRQTESVVDDSLQNLSVTTDAEDFLLRD